MVQQCTQGLNKANQIKSRIITPHAKYCTCCVFFVVFLKLEKKIQTEKSIKFQIL